ncbi:unnamed protein product, partial [marine sediment metagenome]
LFIYLKFSAHLINPNGRYRILRSFIALDKGLKLE